ncbi:hypothetical protein [Lachnospira multipara]|uniref:hypothetical protein n=1 Tax=Lachnospira multipara TaxID=28051 RepID=UPI000486F3F2|nr:hypothetical protein [Lachnospira multipara]
MKPEEFINKDEEYIIPVSWEVYSTIRVKGAKNLQDAIEYAKTHIDDIPLGDGEYIDGSYKIEIHNDDEAIAAQDYADIGGVVVYTNPYREYALEVRVNGEFDRQIDVFVSVEEAEEAAKEVSLKPNETIDIVCIEYDENMHELSAESIY